MSPRLRLKIPEWLVLNAQCSVVFSELTSSVLQNGGYPNPPAQRRQFRDPYGGWWDPQDRRNFGEPVHEDNDILGTFTTESYTHFKAPKAFFLMGCAITTVFAFSGLVSLFYPDKPSVPRTFEDGLEKELGGANAVRARKPGEDSW
uniref:NADH:ubiquinone oxidoreductase 20.1kD subunit n=1 Tax=Coccidioides posadasii RMSCC 3488 TaxID=454284 RepID=A0A0J6FGP1_COCPO|nr:NADH:ubiquinone oxidoreductase 20.1kD subunit [Coccidioides posadasii RMSCC 3488]